MTRSTDYMQGQLNKYKFRTTADSDMPTSQMLGNTMSMAVKKRQYSTRKRGTDERQSNQNEVARV